MGAGRWSDFIVKPTDHVEPTDDVGPTDHREPASFDNLDDVLDHNHYDNDHHDDNHNDNRSNHLDDRGQVSADLRA